MSRCECDKVLSAIEFKEIGLPLFPWARNITLIT